MTRFNALILLVIVLTMILCAGCLQEQKAAGVNDTTSLPSFPGGALPLLHSLP